MRGRLVFLNIREHLASTGRVTLPEWITRGDGVSHRYWAKIWQATPPWLNASQIERMREIYNGTPLDYHVDHIVPLKGDLVCGLHVPWNLQYMPAKSNMSKGNRYWPGCPHENAELFELEPGPYQMRLI